MPSNNISLNNNYLSRILNKVAPFYSLSTPRDMAATIALQQILGLGGEVASSNTLMPPPEATTLVDIILNTTEGAYSTIALRNEENNNVLAQIGRISEGRGSNRNLGNRFENFVNIYYFGPIVANANETLRAFTFPTMSQIIGSSATNDSPEDTKRRISCYKILSPHITPASRNTGLASLWFNGIPTIELSRAVPYLDIRFISGRESTDQDSRLNAMSIYKFLEGAVETASNLTLSTILMANTVVSSSITGARNTSGYLNEAGMELFTMPQTAINANTNTEIDSANRRAVPVRDPMRPFMTFKNITITVAPTVGLMSFKTAELEFVLHDSSRLHEIADFIKPDLYGTTELLIEYGWIHPDGPLQDNIYADLMNYSRPKEKYQIRNASFSLAEAGEVNIKLSIAMKGGSDFTTETIAKADPAGAAILGRINALGEAIARYRDSSFNRENRNANSGTTVRTNRPAPEIRGHQILDFASDWQNHLQIPREMSDHLTHFLAATTNQGTGPMADNMRALGNSLRELYTNNRSPGRAAGGSQITQLQTNIVNDIRAKINKMFERTDTPLTSDPFLPDIQVPGTDGTGTAGATLHSVLTDRRRPTGQAGGAATLQTLPRFTGTARFVSLAKLLIHFIAIPLAATGKFDDVQLLFYPFNSSAGYANSLNIGQFVVDTNYFLEQYARFRLESVQRAANVNLVDFMAFIASTLIDDPMATTYGIGDLYTQTRGGENVVTVAPAGNAAQFQSSLERRLSSQTPNGDFKMPQVNCYVEACPLRRNLEGSGNLPNSNFTILRLHFFDRQTSPYEGQIAILQGSREGVLNSISNIPDTANQPPSGQRQIIEAHREAITSVINAAGNILEPIPVPAGGATTEHPPYMIRGGTKAIKDFLMRTMPSIIYGAQGTTIKSAQLSSMQDPALSTVNMLRSFRSSPLRANGEQPGGLPLQIIPCELSVDALGCSLVEFSQQFFIDFGTGTTADNIYGINGIEHKIEPGVFETKIKFVPLDAYGKYSSFLERINQAGIILQSIAAQDGSAASSQGR